MYSETRGPTYALAAAVEVGSYSDHSRLSPAPVVTKVPANSSARIRLASVSFAGLR
jgi:hypothetical protein